jgi:hypothetical protein
MSKISTIVIFAFVMFLGVSNSSFAAANVNLLHELSLKKGQKYATAKKHLINNGWKIDLEYASSNAKPHTPYGFKEVVCGTGLQAVCSVRFLRGDREIMVILQPKEYLIVESAWDDK